MYLFYLIFASFSLQHAYSNGKRLSYNSRYRILSTKAETGDNIFCFYNSNRGKCNQTQSFGPENYTEFRKYIKSNNSVQIIVVENIVLSTPLTIGNMDSKSVSIRGESITGSIFIEQNYKLIDESGVLAHATISIDGSFLESQNVGFLRLTNSVQIPPQLIALLLSDFPTDIMTTPFTGSFYSGPNATATVTPSSINVAGGKYDISISYFGGNLHWRADFKSLMQLYCLCPSGNCESCRYPQISSLDIKTPPLYSNTTLVLIQIPNGTNVTVNLENIDRKRSYVFLGDDQNELTLHFDSNSHISEFPSLTFSNLILNFETSNPNVLIRGPNVKLNKTSISDQWSNKITIDNIVTDVDSLESILSDNKNLTIFTDSSEIALESEQSRFDQKNISKPLQKVAVITSNNHLKYSDTLGSQVTLKPGSGSNSQTIEINELHDNSQLSISSYKNVNLKMNNISSNKYKMSIEDFNNLNIEGTQPISLDHLNLNGNKTKSAHIQSNVPIHFNNLNFEDEQRNVPKELIISNGKSTDADHIYIGQQNTDLIQNLKMNQELTLQSRSSLECSNCSFDNRMNYCVITGKVAPPPELQLSSGSADNFNPKSISIFVTSKNEPKSQRYNITNRQYYSLISGFTKQEQCERTLKSIVDLPADFMLRCNNGVLELNTGAFYDFWPGEHYSGLQIFGMVMTSIICAACSYVIFIYI